MSGNHGHFFVLLWKKMVPVKVKICKFRFLAKVQISCSDLQVPKYHSGVSSSTGK